MKRVALAVLMIVGCTHVSSPRFIEGPHGRLHVDDGGSGPGLPVILIHGNGANLTQWRAQLDHLRRTRRAVAFDLHGFGESERRPGADYSLGAMTGDIDAVTRALGIDRFVLVGHSYGGSVAGAYAAARPERVAAVVFADAAGNVQVTREEAAQFLDRIRTEGPKFVEQWFKPVLKGSLPEVERAVHESVKKTPPEVMASALESILFFDMGAAIRAYPGPKFAIAAAPMEQPVSLHVQFPEVTTRKIDGVSHWLMMDKPAEFNAALDEILGRF